MSRVIQPGKLLGETKTYSWDFGSDLATGETLLTPTITATVYSGTDATPSNLVYGSPTISGTKVTQLLSAGTLGVIYEVLCSVLTSAGQTLKRASFVAVVPDLE